MRTIQQYFSDIIFEENFPTTYFHLKYIVLSVVVFMVTIIRHVCKSYNISIPFALFCILFGLLWGIGSLYFKWMKIISYIATAPTLLQHLNNVYMPIMIFKIGFCMDFDSFVKYLPQIAIIAIPGFFMRAFLVGLMMILLLDLNLNYLDGFFVGVIVSSIYSIDILHCLKASTAQVKYLTILLHGEIFFSLVLSVICSLLTVTCLEGWVIQWHQFLTFAISQICSIPIGFLFGLIGVFFMKIIYDNLTFLILVTMCICWMSFLCTKYICNVGVFGVVITSVMMSNMRSLFLSKDRDEAIQLFWQFLSCLVNGYFSVVIGLFLPIMMINTDLHESVLTLVTYLTVNLSRFITLFMLLPILNKIGYGMSIQNVVIMVWCGLSNPLCIVLAIDVSDIYGEEDRKSQILVIHAVLVYLLLLIINGSSVSLLLRGLGLKEISVLQQTSMNNCMNYIYEARATSVAILKMDRLLSDANWPMIMSATSLKHPYRQYFSVGELEDEDNGYQIENRFTPCPKCHKNIPMEPTVKEFRQMTNEAKIIMLKFQKRSFSKQFENGIITKKGLQILHHFVDDAMNSEDLTVKLDQILELFNLESWVYKAVQPHIQKAVLSKDKVHVKNLSWFRSSMYYLSTHSFMILVILMNISIAFSYIFLKPGKIKEKTYSVLYITFSVVYFIEIMTIIVIVSWLHGYINGLKIYFSKFWTVLQFITFCLTLSETTKQRINLGTYREHTIFYIQEVLIVFLLLRLYTIILRLKKIKLLKLLPTIFLNILYKKINKHKLLAYELCMSYVSSTEEILKHLSQLTENVKIRENLKKQIEENRHIGRKRLGLAQKERPSIACTVKTITAMRIVMNTMKKEIYDMKISGFIDEVEYRKLKEALSKKSAAINSIKLIEPTGPQMIFRELPFMSENNEIVEYLYNHLSMKKFDPGDVVIHEREESNGIYLLITGIFALRYIPNEGDINNLKNYGILPVIDHLPLMSYEKPAFEYWTPGNSFGELSTLTGRRYSGTVIAETHSEVYFLKAEVINTVLTMDKDPVNGFACRMWKFAVFKKALDILSAIPAYKSHGRDKISYLLETAFVPNLSNYKIFAVNDWMQDIILIEGVVVDFNSKHTYVAPCYIPRTIQKLILPKSSAVDIKIVVETKLLIIPNKDYNEYEIMMETNDKCEFVNENETGDFVRFIQDKTSLSIKSSRTSNSLKGFVKQFIHSLRRGRSIAPFDPA